MSFKNYYKILEVAYSATEDEIKKSYRRLALLYHPDRTFGDKVAEEKFKQVQEAYDTLSDTLEKENYDYEYNKEKEKYFARKQQNASQGQTYQKKEEPSITPYTFFRKFRDIRLAVDATAKENINQKALSDSLKNLLSDNCISFLLTCGDTKINHEIIEEALEACKPLNISYFEEIGIKLAKLAGSDNSIIQSIKVIQVAKRLKSYWVPVKIFGGIALLVICVILANNNSHSTYSSPSYYSSSTKEQPASGDVYITPSIDSSATNTSKTQKLSNLKQDDYSDWEITNYESGSSPQCYNYKPKFTKGLNNYIKVSVGSNTDAVIKVINSATRKCIRYVYVRSGDTYFIRNLPEGQYYLKLAYGKDWRKKIENGKCVGKFVYNALYKKGEETLDFRKVYTGVETQSGKSYRTYQIPSYSLSLNVIDFDTHDQFNSFGILENEFNDDE